MATTLERTERHVRTRPAIIDCDVHPEIDSEKDLYPYLSARWLEHLKTYGMRTYSGSTYPRFQNRREDAFPPNGRDAGTDCAFMSKQLLDEAGVHYAILNPPSRAVPVLNPEFSAAIASAVNDWQVVEWLDKEPRTRSSISAAIEYPDLAVAEIERRAKDPRFVQVQFTGRPAEPMGRRKYWPIYEVAEAHGLAIMTHAFGSGGHPITGAGAPSYYIEDHVGPAQSMAANLISMIVEGVFDRFPGLRVVSAENGFGWVPSLMWRLDSTYDVLKGEVPHLTRRPSEYLDGHVWFCTQPIEEPHQPRDLGWIIEQIGVDRLVFASDYAHWDWDSPDTALPSWLPEDVRRKIFYENAQELYRLPDAAPGV